jgi:alpha,alpha-trehalase
MYYWDTYFACRGLLLSKRYELVANNLRNFMYMIDTYGFIPNGSLKVFLNRSQPPFFGMMLKSYFDATGDKELFSKGLCALKKELEFWNTRRRAANGLNHYSCDDTEAVYVGGVRMYEERTGVIRTGDEPYLGKNVFAEAESGWDFCGRFGGRCLEYNAVDLNSLLYFDEMLLANHLEGEEAEKYAKRARTRKEKMNALLRGEDGIFYDYSYVTGKCSGVMSCASFFPYFVGMDTCEKGLDKLLSSLELGFGLQAAEHLEGNFQWGENNGWACLQLVACEALEACGLLKDSRRIAEKYVSLVEKCFEETGHLWEKYNVLDGSSNAVSEYGTPAMIGWSAGVYLSLKAKL